MSVLKKLIASAFLLLVLIPAFSQDGYFTGDGGKGKRVLAHYSTLENGRKDKSDSWIPSKIKRDIINTLINCSNVTVINSDEKDNIRKIQKEYESSEYSEDNPVQLGQSVQAKYYITFTTTRLNDKTETYTLSATIYNIETRIAEGGYTSPQFNQSDFISKVPGLASAELLTKLGVKLTSAGRRLIQYGDSLAQESSSTDIKTAQENLEVIDAELTRISKEQTLLTAQQQLSLEAQAEEARMETQKALLLQQQKNEQERIERLKQDAAKQQEEEIAKLERDEKRQQEILRLSMEIESKAEKIKNERSKTLSASQQIVIIEGEKQTLYSNEKIVEQSIKESADKLRKQRDNEIQERKKQPPRKAELKADGVTLTESARELLDSDIKAIQEKYDQLIIQNEVEIKKETIKTQNQLRESIADDIETLEKRTYTASSLSDDGVYFRVDNWDGTKGREGWQYSLSFSFAGQTIYKDRDILSYETITGKKIPDVPKKDSRNYEKQLKDYDEFCDTVDNYDSFFRLNVPYLQVEIEYEVSAGSYKAASEYIVKIQKVTFKNVDTGKKIRILSPQKNITFKYTNGITVDWRTNKQQEKDLKKEAKDKLDRQKKTEKENRDRKAEKEKQERIKKNTSGKSSSSGSEKKSSDDGSIQDGRGTFATLVYDFVPGSFSYYKGEDISFFTLGYILTVPLSSNFFIGANAELGAELGDTEYYFSSSYDSSGEDKELFVDLSGMAGLSLNLTKNIRLSAFGEFGYIWKGFGKGVGASIEIYAQEAFGLMGSFTLIHTNSCFLEKYCLAMEICF